jgi:glycosyltransferase involved in cell wall biosynthesis
MISVVIPTRNRASFLNLALKSISQQTLSGCDFEVLVVDNGSIDETAQVIATHNSAIFNLRAIYAPDPGLHTGRHVGIKIADGDILVFADDDIEALPTWLESIKECFSDPNVAMVGGNNYPMFLETPPKWILKLWTRNKCFGYRAIPALSVLELCKDQKEISPYWVWGCNFAIRKDVVLSAGGFHPDGMPQDLIRFRGDGETHVSRFVAESNMKCVFHPGASVYHKVPASRMTYLYFYQRGFNQGVSDSYTDLRSRKHQFKHDSSVARSVYQKFLQLFRLGAERLLLCKDSFYALKMLNYGHRKGYNFHQEVYKMDAEVREWVHRERYY